MRPTRDRAARTRSDFSGRPLLRPAARVRIIPLPNSPDERQPEGGLLSFVNAGDPRGRHRWQTRSSSRPNRGPGKGSRDAEPPPQGRAGPGRRLRAQGGDRRRHRVPRRTAAALRHHARTVDLLVDGKTETVLIQEVQHDHLGTELHARRLPPRVQGRAGPDDRGHRAPRDGPGATGGGVLDQPLHRIHVECPAIAIPESIRVNIDGLLLGQAIHVKELDLPRGREGPGRPGPGRGAGQACSRWPCPSRRRPGAGGRDGRAGGHHQEEGEAGRGGGVTLGLASGRSPLSDHWH